MAIINHLRKLSWIIKIMLGTACFTVISIIGANIVSAEWSSPTSAPPGGNVAAPLNVSGGHQTKEGSLTIGGDILRLSTGNLFLTSDDRGIFWNDTTIADPTKPHLEEASNIIYLSPGESVGSQIALQSGVKITNAGTNYGSILIDNSSPDGRKLELKATPTDAGIDIKSIGAALYLNYDDGTGGVGQAVNIGNAVNPAQLCLNENCITSWQTAIYTAGNGLTLNGNIFELGGALNRATTLTQGANNLAFNLDGAGEFLVQDGGINKFRVAANGDVYLPGITGCTGNLTLDTDASGKLLCGEDLAGGAGTDNYTVYTDGSDVTPGFLAQEIVAGSGINLSTYDAGGGNYKLRIDASGAGDSFWDGTVGDHIYPLQAADTRVRIGWSSTGDSTMLAVKNSSNNSAIYAEQNDPDGYSGYFSGRTALVGTGSLAADQHVTVRNEAFDAVFAYNGSNYLSNTTEAKISGGTPYGILNNTNWYLYVGRSNAQFNSIFFDLATTGAGMNLSFRYWNGSSWTLLSGISDGTSNFSQDGSVSFTCPATWQKTTVNGIEAYFVRISTSVGPSTAATAYLTVPQGRDTFSVFAQAGDATPAFLVNRYANVGIGTGTPQNLLEAAVQEEVTVNNDVDYPLRLTHRDTFENLRTGMGTGLLFEISATGAENDISRASITSYTTDTHDDSRLTLATDVNGTLTDSLTIYNGNTGVNQTSPTAKFVVNNNLNDSGSTGDAVFAAANTTNAAVSARQNNANGFAGYFSGKSAFMNGYVGIGTDSPTDMLHVYNATGDTSALLESTTGASYLSLKSVAGSQSAIGFNAGATEQAGIYWEDNIPQLLIYETGSTTTTNLYLQNGRLGINDSTPDTTLDVNGSVAIATSIFKGDGSTKFFSDCTEGSSIRVINANGTVVCETDDGGGGTDELVKVSSNDTTAGYLNGKLVAGTNITLTEVNDAGNETLRIDASGGGTNYWTQVGTSLYPNDNAWNVGIGLTNPVSKLHVYGGKTWGSDFGLDATGTTGGRRWSLISTGGDAGEGQGKFLIKDNNSGTVRLTIDTAGSVGLGTTNPTQKLHVNGNIYSETNRIFMASYGANWQTGVSGHAHETLCHNCVWDTGDSRYEFTNNHASFGARMIGFQYNGSTPSSPGQGFHFYEKSGATTAGGEITWEDPQFSIMDTKVTFDNRVTVGVANSEPIGRFVVNNGVSGQGSAGDAIATYASTTNSAIYAQQNNLAGYAGYFSGTTTIKDGGLIIDEPSLQKRGQISGPLDGASDVYVSGKYAYVTSGNSADALVIFDISNPSSPVLVGQISGGANYLDGAMAVQVAGKYAYVASYTSDALVVIDVSDPSSPARVGQITGGANYLDGARDVYVSGGYAYVVAGDSDSLVVINITNPSSPTRVGQITGGANYLDGAWSLYVSGKYAYVVSVLSDSLVVIDVSNPTSPSYVSRYNNVNYYNPRGVYVSGKYAYITYEGSSHLAIINISNPASLSLTGQIVLTTSRNVFVSGKYAYVSGWSSNILYVVDVSNPATPVNFTQYTENNLSPWGIYVSGKYLYLPSESLDALVIFDLSGADISAAAIGNLESNDITVTENVDIGNNLYVRNGINAGPGGFNGLKWTIIDQAVTASTSAEICVPGIYKNNFVSFNVMLRMESDEKWFPPAQNSTNAWSYSAEWADINCAGGGDNEWGLHLFGRQSSMDGASNIKAIIYYR